MPSDARGTSTEAKPEPTPWHALTAEEAASRLQASPERGLTEEEARARLRRYGPNRLAADKPVTFWTVAREEIAEPMILLLLAVGVIYALSGEVRDAVAIFLIIAGIVVVEVYNEYRAKSAIAAMGRLAAPTAPVDRDGRFVDVAVEGLVPGDLVLLRPGERVPADLRLVETTGLRVDESSLTGESVPASKTIDPVMPEAELGDRRSTAYAGSLVVAGRGRGLVVATGMASQLGRIAGLARTAREPRTPLQVAMRQLSGWLVWLALGFSLLVPALGFAFGQPLREMVLTGLTLAFATIPEEMPIIITVVLGLGALRLARRHAIVKRLRAAETLGGVSAIATDKTGTITVNRMTVAEVRPGRSGAIAAADCPASPEAQELLKVGVLANDAAVAMAGGGDGFVGDPTEVALLMAARQAGLDVASLRVPGPVEEVTFDDRRRLMSAMYRRGGEMLIAAKGAPEEVMAHCAYVIEGGRDVLIGDETRGAILASADEMAGRGLRVVALARKAMPWPADIPEVASSDAFESGLTFAGLVGLLDPPRPEVPGAIAALRSAGIRVLMLTGDHPATARAIARATGIDAGKVLVGRDLDALDEPALAAVVGATDVYARITPEHKLRIVRALQARGQVVAVTGDGVNDAPALREAAIGVAMGETGTDVAKEAAGMVLGDDNFATIAVAVAEGRRLFDNLRKAVRYYLAAKVALVSSSLLAVLALLPVPFAPIQIIVMELFMDVAASVAFTTEPPEADVMARPPRDPRKPFMDGSMQTGILAGGLSLSAAVSIAYFWAAWPGRDAHTASAHAQSVAFATWMVGHLALAMLMRSEREPLLRLGLLTNRAMLLWAAGTVVVLGLALYVPALQAALRTAPLSATDWAVVLAAGLLAPAWMEVVRLVRYR